MKFDPRDYLTAEQQKVIVVILLLLLVGLAVKVWRTARPETTLGPGTTAEQAP